MLGISFCSGASTEKGHSGTFFAQVQIEDSLQIKDYKELQETSEIKFLPPIVLGFHLPADYPSVSPPTLHLSCKWLCKSQLAKLSKRLDELWGENEHQPVLYIWCDFLQQDSLRYLNIQTLLEIQSADEEETTDERVIQDLSSPKLLYNYLVEYNKEQLKLEFDKSVWPCAVCFDEKLGLESFRFYDCGHVYCKDCMASHFTVRIDEGEVKQLTCPADDCNSQGHPSQLKDLLSPELYEKYERLLLQTTLDGMLDVTYCPRTFCQTALLIEPDSSMGTCSSCNFVFCTNCKMSYHGIHPCSIRRGELKEKLDEADEEELDAFKERYGKAFVESLVNECASYSWIDKNCEPCPVCSCKITKDDGCNKMTCTKCKSFFCWLCKAVLPLGNPYIHFRNNPNCHLFPGEQDIDIAFE
ncbi:E3 ubiquitin-protein ligase RNF14-like isoform X2 [Watersipora subatra]|uniref:E3 ubiquitin-protein ligase RNF14-like isoform X2 n=1 Tax=Watersipora subatra TaxID=2589382 RepID=UPI00355AF98D